MRLPPACCREFGLIAPDHRGRGRPGRDRPGESESPPTGIRRVPRTHQHASYGGTLCRARRLGSGRGLGRRPGPGALTGVGFTASLLIGELSFGPGTDTESQAKLAVLAGSVTADALATVVLRVRDRAYRLITEAERVDTGQNGTSDVYDRLSRLALDHPASPAVSRRYTAHAGFPARRRRTGQRATWSRQFPRENLR
ncbi:Na+/H+ antiporter NhaA [Catellatospora sichuanensis]|uniref:Na+/H+ antiporter NhaA n=1 Tax=Catellatospora sichuanensis TaxID=1969805 RepID=UPI001FE55A32|nr:Na+/H+ antiporter NhaA [Catellatospora sichuanensis]